MSTLIGLLTTLNIGLGMAIWIVHGVRSERRRLALLAAQERRRTWLRDLYPRD